MISNKEKLSKKLRNAQQGRRKKITYADKKDIKLLQQTEKLIHVIKTQELQDLRKKDINEFKQKLQQMFPTLHKDNNAIFEMTVNGGMNLNMLKYMIHQSYLIKKGKEDQYNSDVKVGQLLANKFIKNKI